MSSTPLNENVYIGAHQLPADQAEEKMLIEKGVRRTNLHRFTQNFYKISTGSGTRTHKTTKFTVVYIYEVHYFYEGSLFRE